MALNSSYAGLVKTGLPIRFTTLKGGRARVYLGPIFTGFYRNWDIASELERKAPSARVDTHLGRALSRLLARADEAYAEHAEMEKVAIEAMLGKSSRTRKVQKTPSI